MNFWKAYGYAEHDPEHPVDIKSLGSPAQIDTSCTIPGCTAENNKALLSVRYTNPTYTKDYTHHMCEACAMQYDLHDVIHPSAYDDDVKLASQLTPFDAAWDSLEKKLCPEGKAAAKRKFKVYPSAYANGWAVQYCRGKFRKKKGGKKK